MNREPPSPKPTPSTSSSALPFYGLKQRLIAMEDEALEQYAEEHSDDLEQQEYIVREREERALRSWLGHYFVKDDNCEGINVQCIAMMTDWEDEEMPSEEAVFHYVTPTPKEKRVAYCAMHAGFTVVAKFDERDIGISWYIKARPKEVKINLPPI